MAKSAKYHTPTYDGGTANYVARSFGSRVRAWVPFTAKLAVFYAVWILGAYFLNEFVTTSVAAELAAVAYWFGWLFASVSLLFLAGMVLTGVAHDVRHPVQ